MPGEDYQSWSVTAADNANSDTSINWQEGQARASVNNSSRSELAAHAKNRNLLNGSIVTGGSPNAQTFTAPVPYTVVPTGLRVLLKIGVTNTGPATLNMNGIGDVVIKDYMSRDLVAGVLHGDTYAEFIYNGTYWVHIDTHVQTLPGVSDGSDAPAGFLGEVVQFDAAAATFFPSNVWSAIAGAGLSAGDWDVSGGCNVSGLVTAGQFYLSIGTVVSAQNVMGGYTMSMSAYPDIWANFGPVRMNLAAATTVWLNAYNTTSTTTATVQFIRIYARRVR